MIYKFWVRSFQQRASMVHFVFFFITDTWELCLNNCASASASAERLGLAPPWQYYSACVLFSFYCFCIFYSIGFHVLVNIICDTSDLINERYVRIFGLAELYVHKSFLAKFELFVWVFVCVPQVEDDLKLESGYKAISFFQIILVIVITVINAILSNISCAHHQRHNAKRKRTLNDPVFVE